MPTAPLGTVLRHIRNLAVAPGTGELTDKQLLQRFADRQEEDVFAALMQRHGQLVWGVCRHVLRHEQDAEDAFQATFLVLARHSTTIRKQEALASFLHGTAYRIALRARRAALIRRTHESRGQSMPAEKPFPETVLREALAVLDEEVQGLPPRQRSAFVLCALEGNSLAEAAHQLGWKPGTVSGTLARARRQLKQRLTRRGVTLSAVLGAVALGRQAASAALPPGLARSTTRAALLYAAGQTAVPASPTAAALAEGVTKTMFLTKCKVATVFLLAVGLAGAGLLTRQALAGKQPPAPLAPKDAGPAAPERKGRAGPAAHPDKAGEAVEVAGRVLGADGKPYAGAEVFVWTNAVKKQADLRPRAVTDADGRFRLTLARADQERDAKVVVRAKGHGPDWAGAAGLERGGEMTLRLAKDDVPINGRVIDLEGQSVPGVTIEVGRLEQNNMKSWLEAARQGTTNHYDRDLAPEALDGPTTVTTGKDGRFRLTGFGRDRVVLLRLRGDNIEHCVFWVVTRDEPLPGMRVGPYGTYSATFTHHTLPSKPIVGTVRDRATGKPLAGIAVVSSMYNNRWTRTDANGRYRIVGAAKHDRYSVSAGSAPYLNCTKMDVADTLGLEPLTVDFDLDRGVAIKGRLTDKATGKPVRGYLNFIPLADNPNIKNFSELGKLQIIASDEAHAKADGTFTVTAIPGPGVLCARADDEDQFLAAEAEGIKLAKNVILDGYHAVVPVTPSDEDPKSTHIDVALATGRSLSGTVVGPDGQPLAGAHAAGLSATPKFFDRSAGKLDGAAFTVSALHHTKPRALLFVHPEKKLAKMVKVRPDEAGPLVVRLEPSGALAGRFVDAGGKPLAGLKVRALLNYNPEDTRGLPAEVRYNAQAWGKLINGETTTDGKGKFRIDGLVPGLKYLLNVQKEMEFLGGFTRDGLTVEPGKVTDLGELKDKPVAKKEANGQP
jgi:RNA polymerase sigma factor (sigma-70 family)